MISVLSLSKLVHLPSSKQLRGCQWVRRYRCVTQCGRARGLPRCSPLVLASLRKHLHPPTLIFRTKDIKLTANLNQNLKVTYL